MPDGAGIPCWHDAQRSTTNDAKKSEVKRRLDGLETSDLFNLPACVPKRNKNTGTFFCFFLYTRRTSSLITASPSSTLRSCARGVSEAWHVDGFSYKVSVELFEEFEVRPVSLSAGTCVGVCGAGDRAIRPALFFFPLLPFEVHFAS